MTNAYMPGSLVRLTFDQGPASIGVVQLGDQPIRSDDGVRLVPIHWVDHLTAPDDLDPERLVNEPGTLLPTTILVPLCEHVETFADGFGLACSEPGVPTTIDVPCHYDATHALVVHGVGAMACDPEPINLCDGHAALYRTEPHTVVVEDEAV